VLLLNKILLMLHFLGLAMGLAVPLANMVMGSLIAKAAGPEKAILGRFPLAMGKVGKIGLSLLWVTGVTMVFTRWAGFAMMPPLFNFKLAAVVLLSITVGYVISLEPRARKGDMAAIARMEKCGKVAFGFALLAVIFAVLTFN
jgi:hypothetical protein